MAAAEMADEILSRAGTGLTRCALFFGGCFSTAGSYLSTFLAAVVRPSQHLSVNFQGTRNNAHRLL